MTQKTLLYIIIDFLIYLFNRKNRINATSNTDFKKVNDKLNEKYNKIDDKYVKEPEDVQEISDRLNNRF